MVGLLIINVSKGAWISFLVALFFLGLWKRKIFTYTVVVFLILVLITPLFFRLALNFSQFFHALFTLSDASSLDRKEMWEGAMNMIKAKPVFGHGPSTFMANFEKYRPAGYSEVVYAHNCYLQIAAESGIFALLAFSWMIALFFFRSIKAMVKIRDEFLKTFLLGLLGGILSFLIHSGVDTDMYQLQLVTLFWFSLGLAVAVQKIWEREKLEPLKILKQKKLSGV
jgi:putative inorganic carbon (HCO3(-)) transporter